MTKVNLLHKIKVKEISFVRAGAAQHSRMLIAKRAPEAVEIVMFEDFLKGNPWHAANGQFTSGPDKGGSPAYHMPIGGGLVTDMKTGQLVSDPGILARFKDKAGNQVAVAPGPGDQPYDPNATPLRVGGSSRQAFQPGDFTTGKQGFKNVLVRNASAAAAAVGNLATSIKPHVDVHPNGLILRLTAPRSGGGNHVISTRFIPHSAFQGHPAIRATYQAFRAHRGAGGTLFMNPGGGVSPKDIAAVAGENEAIGNPGVQRTRAKNMAIVKGFLDSAINAAGTATGSYFGSRAGVSHGMGGGTLSDAQHQQRVDAANARWSGHTVSTAEDAAARVGSAVAGTSLLLNSGRIARLGARGMRAAIRGSSLHSGAASQAVRSSISNAIAAARSSGSARAIIDAAQHGATLGAAAGRQQAAAQLATFLGRSKLGAAGLIGGALAGGAALYGAGHLLGRSVQAS